MRFIAFHILGGVPEMKETQIGPPELPARTPTGRPENHPGRTDREIFRLISPVVRSIIEFNLPSAGSLPPRRPRPPASDRFRGFESMRALHSSSWPARPCRPPHAPPSRSRRRPPSSGPSITTSMPASRPAASRPPRRPTTPPSSAGSRSTSSAASRPRRKSPATSPTSPTRQAGQARRSPARLPGYVRHQATMFELDARPPRRPQGRACATTSSRPSATAGRGTRSSAN